MGEFDRSGGKSYSKSSYQLARGLRMATRLAIYGCGFWARYQIAAWRELPGVEIVALYNRTRAKAEALGAEFGVRAIYDDPEALIALERPDAIDIITDADSHGRFVHLAA